MQKDLYLAAVLFAAGVCHADIVLQDFFDNNNLTNSITGFNGGFNVIGTGGDAIETNGIARISNAPNGSSFGILSVGTVSLGGTDELKTRWIISNSDLKNNAHSLEFVWQLESVLNTNNPNLALVLDLDSETASFSIDGSIVTNDALSASFGSVGDAFEVVATFSLSEGSFAGSGTLKNSGSIDLNLTTPWGGTVPALTALHVGASAHGKGYNAMVIEFSSVTVETIPEPAVISLISLFGGGMIFSRRIFGRKKSDSGA